MKQGCNAVFEALSAKKYLDEHQLLNWAHRLFQDLIHDQPEDPWAYIDRRTVEAQAADVHKAELKKMEEAQDVLEFRVAIIYACTCIHIMKLYYAHV